MKRILPILMASIAIAASPLSAEQLKVLMIGNSFSHSVLVWLPRIAEQAGEDLLLANLMIPGCELKTHAENIAKTEADPGFKPYNYDRKIGTKLEPRTKESIQGAVMASDGFFPFADGIEVAAKEGVTAVIAPAGSIKDAEVIQRANELGVAFFHAPERVFSHH